MILGLSGRKSAGKNTFANWLTGFAMQHVVDLVDGYKINDMGLLEVPVDLDGVVEYRAIRVDKSTGWLEENVYPAVKQFAFADELKSICMKLFGLSWTQCYGSDEDKNSFTSVKLDDLSKTAGISITPVEGSEFATARQVLQYFGTEVVRKIHANAWVNATLKNVEAAGSQIAVITDVRFPEEVEAIQAAGGYVVRLLRNPYADKHASERALDKYEGFNLVFDNRKLSIPQMCIDLFTEINKSYQLFDVEIACQNIEQDLTVES